MRGATLAISCCMLAVGTAPALAWSAGAVAPSRATSDAQAPAASAPQTPAPQTPASASAPGQASAEAAAQPSAAGGGAMQTNPYVKAGSTAGAPENQADSQRTTARLALERMKLRVMLAEARRSKQKAAQESAAKPDEPVHGNAGAPFAIGASLEAPFYVDRSYDLFSSHDNAGRAGLWLAYDLLALRRDAFLAAELGWATEHVRADGLRGETLSSELTADAFHVGAQLRYVPLSFLQPHARLAAGVEYLRAQVTSTAPSTTFKDKGWPFFASVGLGATLRTPTRLFEDPQGHLASLSVGLMLEGGYTLASPVDLALDGPAPSKRGIGITEPKLGKLDRSGPYARASLVVRF